MIVIGEYQRKRRRHLDVMSWPVVLTVNAVAWAVAGSLRRWVRG